MKGIFDNLINAFRLPDLRKKILFTMLILGIYMVGGLVPAPGINREVFTSLVQDWGQLGGLMDIISGGGLYAATIFAMGISPYINSSIIIQLLTAALPPLERLAKEGEEGRKKIQKIVRFTTVGLALLQASVFCWATRSAMTHYLPSWLNAILIVATFTAGTCFVVFLGERINEKGIGNGISLIIFAGIATRLPDMARQLYNFALDVAGRFKNVVLGDTLGVLLFIGVALFSIAIIVFVVFIQNSERRVTVQYSKRVVGRKVYGGQNTYIPFKVNQSGVMPVIFTMSIMALPSTIVSLFFSSSNNSVANFFRNMADQPVLYFTIQLFFIMAFVFFYSAITFNANEISNNLQKNGGFIPGVRPGGPTRDYIQKTASRLNWADGIFLCLVVLVPSILGTITNMEGVWFAGTSVLILTGVANDFVQQIESQMVTHHYKGFLD
ncbi:MAG TPA: preprotein translocase subunit SecY [Bacillota bacterium]|nr:preprotein translocase subunit SecY [Bacillota bacterium]HPE37878.1 preprotein translocase subunit SecY [Bacillota bacterium]